MKRVLLALLLVSIAPAAGAQRPGDGTHFRMPLQTAPAKLAQDYTAAVALAAVVTWWA